MIYLDDENEATVARQLRRSIMLRNLRRWLVMVCLLGVFVETQGAPFVRVVETSRSRGPQQVPYWGVTGKRTITLENPPLVVLAPLDRSVTDYAGDLLQVGLAEVEVHLDALSGGIQSLWELF